MYIIVIAKVLGAYVNNCFSVKVVQSVVTEGKNVRSDEVCTDKTKGSVVSV